MKCQHCQSAPITRPRKLCWICYYTPEIRARYPSTSKFGRRGDGNFFCRTPLPDAPTCAEPGSSEKVAVLAERARRRQSLWHPHDAPRAKAA